MAYIALVQIDFSDGSAYFSFHGVASPTAWYEPYVESIDNISRVSPVDAQGYSVSDLQINFINWNQYFTHKKGNTAPGKYFYNRSLKVLYGDESLGVAAMATIFQGRISKWQITEDGSFQVTVRDFSYDRFRVPVTSTMKVLDTATFPNLPVGTQPRLVPVIYGTNDVDATVDLTTYNLGGPVPCYLIDTNAAGKWRYVVAQHQVKSVITVFVYGVKTAAGNYTVSTQTYGTKTMTVIDFNADPRTSSRSSELEVTASVAGMCDDHTSSGTLLVHPGDILNDYMTQWTGTVAAEINSTSFAAAKALTPGYLCGIVVTEIGTLHSDIMDRWSQSFVGSIYVDSSAKFAIYIKTSATLVAATTSFTQDVEIVGMESGGGQMFQINSNENVAASLTYNWMQLWPRSFFVHQDTSTVSNQSVTLNATITQSVDLSYVRDSTTAASVVASYADLFKEDVEYIAFEVTPDQVANLDLNNTATLTHWQGIGPSGYSQVTVRIYELIFHLTPLDVHLVVRALKLHTPANAMIRPRFTSTMIRPIPSRRYGTGGMTRPVIWRT